MKADKNDNARQNGQCSGGDPVGEAPLTDQPVDDDDDRTGQECRDDQLEEAAPRVIAVGHAADGEGVQAAEQVNGLQRGKEQEHHVERDQNDQCLGRAQAAGRSGRLVSGNGHPPVRDPGTGHGAGE